jgi:endogenous inhibitor of DNA gyrase (YacG/DUF329 family)
MAQKLPQNCPICGKVPNTRFLPFCSQRCATIDLGRWLGEGYKVQTEETPENEAE